MAANDIFQIIRGQVTGSDGLPQMRDIRVWVGSVTTANGSWTVDFTLAGITQVLHVVVTPVSNITSTTDAPVATVRSYTTTSASGYVLQNNLLGFGLKKSTSSVKLFVQVYGI